MKITSITFFLILEYLLIAKQKLISLFDNQPPANWQVGSKGNVLLIPGLTETYVFLKTIGRHLNMIGYKVYVIRDLNPNDKIENIAGKIGEFIKTNNLEKVHIIAHSKGAIASRFLAVNYPEINRRIIKLFTIAAPHHGSLWAYIIFTQKQLNPRSGLLKKLNTNNDNGKIINIYPCLDNHVIPNRNLILEGAENIVLNMVGHTNILESRTTINIIKKHL